MKRVASWRPRLVAVEGTDGAGKSTLVKDLAVGLRKEGWKVATTAEPSESPIAERAKREAPSNPLGAALLFTLDRVTQGPALLNLLARNDLVLSDRSFYSTLAYQGSFLSAREQVALRALEEEVAILPDVVLWIDGAPDEALRRVDARQGGADRIERIHFQRKVRDGYVRLAREEPDRFVRIDLRLRRESMVRRGLAVLHQRWPNPPRPARP